MQFDKKWWPPSDSVHSMGKRSAVEKNNNGTFYRICTDWKWRLFHLIFVDDHQHTHRVCSTAKGSLFWLASVLLGNTEISGSACCLLPEIVDGADNFLNGKIWKTMKSLFVSFIRWVEWFPTSMFQVLLIHENWCRFWSNLHFKTTSKVWLIIIR